MRPKVGLVPFREKWVDLALLPDLFWIWLIIVPYWERWNSLGMTWILLFRLINKNLPKEFQFGTQSDYVSVLALIMEAVQEIGGFSSCRQRRAVQPQN
jgi:hypothetical protein